MLGHDRHVIAAGHAVVVAVGAAVDVGEVGRVDLDSIALREVWLDCGRSETVEVMGLEAGMAEVSRMGL